MRDLEYLDEEFGKRVRKLLAECRNEGFWMQPFFTLRTPVEQAKLWRQSRNSKTIRTAIADLERAGAPYLAKVLQSVGPQHGNWATNALPGQSWHQYGLAVDCFLQFKGKAVWDRDHKAYETYAMIAESMGLTAGYFWEGKSKDPVHVQYPVESSPQQILGWQAIDEKMREKFTQTLSNPDSFR